MWDHSPLLWVEFSSMLEKGQWVVLPYHGEQKLLGMQLNPPGTKVERDRQPHWLVDYSFNTINTNTLPLAVHLTDMQ